MSQLPIVAVGYNRPRSLSRLLNALLSAHYDGDNVPLIISLDHSGNADIEQIALQYEWPYGEKHVIVQPERLGLRKHILKCGDYALEYGAVIVLEDDLYVSPHYYRYTKQAIEAYKDEPHVAGISLYSHLWNVTASRPFQPVDDGYDAYFFQFAQSWGQCWTEEMWRSFRNWYELQAGGVMQGDDLPQSVVKWPESSWLKYFIKYIVETNKYYVYPRVSLTTNFGDIGQHARIASTSYQVPLMHGHKEPFRFPQFDKANTKYDVFFERLELGKALGIPDDDVTIDLYGEKGRQSNRRYWLTMEKAHYRVLASYGCQLRPHEMNVLQHIPGEDIFLYDTSVIEEHRQTDQLNTRLVRSLYDIRAIRRTDIMKLAQYYLVSAMKRKWKKLFSS